MNKMQIYRFSDKLPITNTLIKDMKIIHSLTVLTTNQAAKELDVSTRTIQLWIQQGEFPNAFKLTPGNKRNSPLRIPRVDIESFRRRRNSQTLQTFANHE
jgi:transposase